MWMFLYSDKGWYWSLFQSRSRSITRTTYLNLALLHFKNIYWSHCTTKRTGITIIEKGFEVSLQSEGQKSADQTHVKEKKPGHLFFMHVDVWRSFSWLYFEGWFMIHNIDKLLKKLRERNHWKLSGRCCSKPLKCYTLSNIDIFHQYLIPYQKVWEETFTYV